jgi:excisionase family DNA binding protein
VQKRKKNSERTRPSTSPQQASMESVGPRAVGSRQLKVFDRILGRPGEIAEMLGSSRSTVYALIAAGELPSIRLGKSIRVPLDRLHEWIEKKS